MLRLEKDFESLLQVLETGWRVFLLLTTKAPGTATMTTHSPESLPSFEFVIQDPNERFSKETKTKIRKQAMRAVGARRRSDGPKSPGPTAVSRHRQRGDSDKIPSLVSMPLAPLELLVRNSGIDPIDLSALASVHIGAMLVGSNRLRSY